MFCQFFRFFRGLNRGLNTASFQPDTEKNKTREVEGMVATEIDRMLLWKGGCVNGGERRVERRKK